MTVREASLPALMTYLAAVTLGQSQDLTFRLQTSGLRIAAVFLVITMFVLSMSYSSSLMSVLTGVKYCPLIT